MTPTMRNEQEQNEARTIKRRKSESAEFKQSLVGRQRGCAAASSTPGSECWPEEDALVGGRTPAKPRWSEVMIFLDDFLRQRTPLPEETASAPMRRALIGDSVRRLAQLRGANVRRRRMFGGRPNSGEAAVVGGDRLFGCCPPAEQPLPEDGVSSDEQGAHRSWCGAG
jgi:hypothetical protein